MVKQYPHTITVTVSNLATLGNDGNWLPPATESTSFEGRFETNAKSLFLETTAGTRIVYAGIVYGKFEPVTDGADVVVMNGAETIAKGRALQCSKGQLNTRLWLG